MNLNVASLTAMMMSLSIFGGCTGTRSSQPRELFSLPITGQFNDGTAAFGQATAMSDGRGIFWVKVPNGTRCSGSYNVGDHNPTLVVPVSCDDGARGETVITRTPDLMSGSAIVALNNGRRGQVVFGNLRFEQVFGAGGSVRTL